MQFDTGCHSSSTNVKSDSDNDCIVAAVILRSLTENSSLGGSPCGGEDAMGIVIAVTVSSSASLSLSTILVDTCMVIHALKQCLRQVLVALMTSSATSPPSQSSQLLLWV